MSVRRPIGYNYTYWREQERRRERRATLLFFGIVIFIFALGMLGGLIAIGGGQ